MVCDGQPLAGLMEKAATLVDLGGFVLKETFCGMRSGSRDFFPVVGRVVDAKLMLDEYPQVRRGAKVPLEHIGGMYILNGLGGRGFVWAPLMAKWLSELIIEDKPITDAVNPDRLFLKWARKNL
jgi:tRNA 5-methylaminomethyl-2-thiouridine biosynthesis bifunctional protein